MLVLPGVRHDYLRFLNKTVNPANGSLSLDLNIPVPTGGVGPQLSFGVTYSSNRAYTIVGTTIVGAVKLAIKQTYGTSVNEWSVYGPYLSMTTGLVTQPNLNGPTNPPTYLYCYYLTNFIFVDRANIPHPLNLAYQPQTQSCGGVTPVPASVTSGGDGIVTAVTEPMYER